MTKYVPNGKPLTDHEREVLTILAEEAAEVVQAVTKILRFGKEDDRRGDRPETNTETLGLEIGDLSCMEQMAVDLGLIDESDVDKGIERKRDRLQTYMMTEPPK